MKNLYLIIIAFVLGILIYTILPKFCGCDKVLEGHGDHKTEHYEKIYHLLNTLPWYDNESEYDNINPASPNFNVTNWTNNTCENEEITTIYKHCLREDQLKCDNGIARYDENGEDCPYNYDYESDSNINPIRIVICQLEEYAGNSSSKLLPDEFQYNLSDIKLDNNLIINENLIKFAKVAHRLIRLQEYLNEGVICETNACFHDYNWRSPGQIVSGTPRQSTTGFLPKSIDIIRIGVLYSDVSISGMINPELRYPGNPELRYPGDQLTDRGVTMTRDNQRVDARSPTDFAFLNHPYYKVFNMHTQTAKRNAIPATPNNILNAHSPAADNTR